MRRTFALIPALAGGVLSLTLASCGIPPQTTTGSAVPAVSPTSAGSAAPAAAPPLSQSASLGTVRLVVGTGWTSQGLGGPAYSTEHCTARVGIFRGKTQPLPDPICTPGAVSTAVTQATLGTTICRWGSYTPRIRPPYSITEPAKYQAMKAYGDGWSARPYEFDHLIPLELGGVSTTQNIWPERNIGGAGRGPYVNNSKDQVEADLHAAVCAGRVPLVAAQRAIASNWTTAEARLGVTYGSGH